MIYIPYSVLIPKQQSNKSGFLFHQFHQQQKINCTEKVFHIYLNKWHLEPYN